MVILRDKPIGIFFDAPGEVSVDAGASTSETIEIKVTNGGFDLVMSAAGKGVLTSSYRGVEGDASKLTIVIVMRDEKTGAELVRLNRYLDRA
jgi:hypothetical protein